MSPDYFLNIDWPNKDHFLLQSFEIKVVQDGTPVTPDPKLGYSLAGIGNTVAIEVTFRLTINGATKDVLHVQATYKANATTIDAVSWTQAGATVSGRHPLVDMSLDKVSTPHASSPGNKSAAVIPRLAAKASIQTMFVDLTAWWFELHGVSDPGDVFKASDEYRRVHTRPDEVLAVLGYTRVVVADPKTRTPVKPLLWFASVPEACRSAGVVGRLVSYRPRNYPYKSDSVDGITDTNHRDIGMFNLCRYLLSPAIMPGAPAWRTRSVIQGAGGDYIILCAGFEDALQESGRAVVVLHPWAHDTDIGDAITSRVPTLALCALSLLHALGRVAVGKSWPAPHFPASDFSSLPPLGLLGYSMGGDHMWPALAANLGKINELYSLDSNLKKGTDPSSLISANARGMAAKKGKCCARVVWGLNLAKASADGLKTLDGKIDGLTVSTHPPSEEFWSIPATVRSGDWWADLVFPLTLPADPKARDAYRTALRHQFALFGGEIGMPRRVTWIEQFLGDTACSFPR